MNNIGEEICGCYLQEIRECDFVQYNLHHPTEQGEIDVIGIDIDKRTVYICEVATHTKTGLRYTKNGKSVNVERFSNKFEKNIKYARENFADFKSVFMLWSPVVKPHQMKDVEEVKQYLKAKFNVEIELIVNDKYWKCLTDLRTFARKETEALTSPILRFMQIEENVKH